MATKGKFGNSWKASGIVHSYKRSIEMANVLDFLVRLKTVKKGGTGLPSRGLRDELLSEHLGPEMLWKLNQVHRARKRHGGTP